MSARDQPSAARELTKLIERALKSVPYLRLDAVAEVTRLFEQAIDALEANLSAEARDSAPEQPEPPITVYTQHKLENIQGFDKSNERRRVSAPFVRPLSSSELRKGQVTRDYSSPNPPTRRISSPHPSSRAEQPVKADDGEDQSTSSNEDSEDEDPKVEARFRNRREEKVPGAFVRSDFSSPSLMTRILDRQDQKPELSSRARDALEGAMPAEAAREMQSRMLASPQAASNRLLLDLAAPMEGDRVSSPKPAFLQRLDRPGSPYAQLTQSQAALHQMLAKALTRVGYIQPSAYAVVHAKLLRAVEALEDGTTLASFRAPEPPVPVSSQRKPTGR